MWAFAPLPTLSYGANTPVVHVEWRPPAGGEITAGTPLHN